MLGEFAIHADKYGAQANGLMVRRKRTELIDTIERSRSMYARVARFHEQDKLWRFENGARLRFAFLERDSDAEGYQGHSYTRVYVEEAGNFPSPAPILKLMATLRSGAGVPCRFRATGNPGGPGHQWVRARYIDPAPLGMQPIAEQYANPWTQEIIVRQRLYIPAKVTDNRFLGGEYVANLQMQASPELVRAWLEGDWSVIAGAYFPEFSLEKHVVKPFPVPGHWLRFRAMDWGSARPFSVGWYAVSDGTTGLPPGALVKYREWYGASEPNVGLGMTAKEVARGIASREAGEKITYAVLDPAAWIANGGPSIAEEMLKEQVVFHKADNSRLSGWDAVRQRLKGEDAPMIYFFDTCRDTIRTLPALQHDARKAEDVDTEGEDHAADETRYACMSRPWTIKQKAPLSPIKGQESMTFNQLRDAAARRRRREE